MKVGDLVELSMERWRLCANDHSPGSTTISYLDAVRVPDKVGVVVDNDVELSFTGKRRVKVQWSTGVTLVEFFRDIRRFKGVR